MDSQSISENSAANSLMDSIRNFKKSKLTKTETVVRSHNFIVVPSSSATSSSTLQSTSTSSSAASSSTPHPLAKLSVSEIHGLSSSNSKFRFELPRCTYLSAELARADYCAETTRSEFQDEENTLLEKIRLLAQMIKKSKRMCAYTGAGISTTSGIPDYASKEKENGTNSDEKDEKSGDTNKRKKRHSLFDCRPTISHRILTAMHSAGFLKHWIQQNHDGLPQKAGFNQAHLNEIHGAWFDPSNEVVLMSGNLREDLFSWMCEWEKKADLVLVLGTSMVGMNSDRVAIKANQRYAKDKCGKDEAKRTEFGAAIVSLQSTQHDASSALRIYGTIDHVMELLGTELGLDMSAIKASQEEDLLYTPCIPKGMELSEDIFLIPFDNCGVPLKTGEKYQQLDLREDSKVYLTCGEHKGDEGIVTGKNREGHWKIRFTHEISKRKGKSFKAPMVRVLGCWFLEAAYNGLHYFPISSNPPSAQSTTNNKMQTE